MLSAKLSISGTFSSSSLLLVLFFFQAGTSRPFFTGEMGNVTVRAGDDAYLNCTVQMMLGVYGVAWVSLNTSTILSVRNMVVSNNPRVGVSQHDNTYRLHLQDVREEDSGYYTCQVNTDPMINQTGYLEVLAPRLTLALGPMLDADDIEEGSDVYFECGNQADPPVHRIHWFHNGNELSHNVSSGIITANQSLFLQKVSARSFGQYTCSTTNVHVTEDSNTVQLNVNFPPMVKTPSPVVEERLGSTAVLECNIEAYPDSINYWIDPWGNMITSGSKYVSIVKDEGDAKTYMRLEVRNLTEEDFNTYHCIAKNLMGEADGPIRLEEDQKDLGHDRGTSFSYAMARNAPSLHVFLASILFASFFFSVKELS